MTEKGTLIFFCGKMGSGKTTYAKQLSKELNAVYISEDEWLSTLYPTEIQNINDYVKYSKRLKQSIRSHVISVLNKKISVVMDFPGNTIKQRSWFKKLINEDNIPHKLIYLKADDTLCLKQLKKRREELPERHQFDTKEVFDQITSYFQEPTNEEAFNLIIINK